MIGHPHGLMAPHSPMCECWCGNNYCDHVESRSGNGVITYDMVGGRITGVLNIAGMFRLQAYYGYGYIGHYLGATLTFV